MDGCCVFPTLQTVGKKDNGKTIKVGEVNGESLIIAPFNFLSLIFKSSLLTTLVFFQAIKAAMATKRDACSDQTNQVLKEQNP